MGTHPELNQLVPEDKKQELQIIDEDVYWEALKNKDYSILNNDNHLIKNAFEFKDSEHEQSRILFNYFKDKPAFFVAGGYPTLQYLEKDLENYLESDIDVFILNKDNNQNQTLTCKEFVEFLDKTFGIIEIRSYTDINAGVFSIKCKNFRRIIQVIGTEAQSISEIFSSFDTSYCKCGLYMGNTYITYDAKYAKEKKTAMFYLKYPKTKRVNKAHNLGLKIYGMPDYEPKEEKESLFKFLRTKEGMLRDFTPVKNWLKDYSNTVCIKLQNSLKNTILSLSLLRYNNIENANSKFVSINNDNVFPNSNDFKNLKMKINYIKSNSPMYMLYPKEYPTFTTGIIEMTKGGLQQIGMFRNSDIQCCQFFIPIGVEFGDNATLNTLSNVDQKIKTLANTFMTSVFPKEIMNYNFIVRDSVVLEDDENQVPYKRIKVNILNDYDYDTKKLKLNINLITQKGETKHIVDMNELRKEFKYGCKARFEIFIDKFWISKNSKNYKGTISRDCGCSMICKTITIVE